MEVRSVTVVVEYSFEFSVVIHRCNIVQVEVLFRNKFDLEFRSVPDGIKPS